MQMVVTRKKKSVVKTIRSNRVNKRQVFLFIFKYGCLEVSVKEFGLIKIKINFVIAIVIKLKLTL